MKINKNLLKKISKLSKIEINKKNIKLITIDLNKIILWIEKLKKINVKNICPLNNMSLENNILRKDKVLKIHLFSTIKKNKYFKIKKIKN